MILDYLTYGVLAVVVVLFLSSAIRILREYERGVVFTLGRFTGVKGPGFIILIPVVQQMVKVDLRVMVQVVPPQDAKIDLGQAVRLTEAASGRKALEAGVEPREGAAVYVVEVVEDDDEVSVHRVDPASGRVSDEE